MNTFDVIANAGRLREILTVLTRYGFSWLAEEINLPGGILERLRSKTADRRPLWERLRLAAEELGPTFVKAGQMLSMRPDLLPQPFILELRKLQDHVQELPFEDMLEVIEEELGAPIDSLFSEFDRKAVAAGSLAQVYFGRLKETGANVAVKVQRPGIQRLMERDLDVAVWIAEQLHARVPLLKPFNLPAVAAEARTSLLQELDFQIEARNQQFFNAQNPYPDQVFAPEVYDALSSRRLLVMERVSGVRVDVAAENLPVAEARRIALSGARSLLDQILNGGFFHADPHAGNVLVMPDGRLCLLDWGLAGHLTRRMRLALADLMVASAKQDAEAIVAIAASLASASALPDLRAMEREVTLAIRTHFNRALPRQEIGRFILRLLHIFGTQGISLTRDYALMAKAVFATEEIARVLDPEFDLAKAATPVLREVQGKRLSVRTLSREFISNARATFMHLRELPALIDRVARRIAAENLTVNLQHRGTENLEDSLNAASNRLSAAVIIAALIVGSSLVITTRVEPLLAGFPALGIIGYVLSAMLGLWIVVDIIRHGRHR